MRVIQWRKSTTVVLGGCLAALVLIVVTSRSYFLSSQCSDRHARGIITSLCAEYSSGEVVGNLCGPLCDTHDIKYRRCTNYADGKSIIFARWQNRTIVLKASKPYWTNYDPIGYKRGKETVMPNDQTFLRTVHNSLEFNLKIDIDVLKTLKRLWFMDFNSSLASSRKATMQSVWSLLQQEEYVFMRYFQNNKPDGHMPDIYGTCGHLYAMEFLPPDPILSPSMRHLIKQVRGAWSRRAHIALQILDLIKAFDHDFHESLHICDMKGDNFGVERHGVVKIIDADMVLLHSKLIAEFDSVTQCRRHSDCDFFDCQGWCDVHSGRCSDIRTNSNLQVTCQKLFLGGVSNMFNGLLANPPSPIRRKLQVLLRECVNLRRPATSAEDTDKQRFQRDATFVYNDFTKLISSSIQLKTEGT